MQCPRCNQKLHKEFHGRTIRYSCPAGHGSWVTFAALRALRIDRETLNELWRNALNGNFIFGAKCPQCGKAMRTLKLADDDCHFELDICLSCQSLWLDHGELRHLPVLQPEPADTLPQRAKEILAEHYVKQLADITSEKLNDAPDSIWKYLPALLGMPVKTNANPTMRLPYLTWAITALCVIVSAATSWDLEYFINMLGFIPQEWMRYGGTTLLTSAFLHGNALHLFGNIYFLLCFGGSVEDAFGKRKYLLLLVISEFSANAIYACFAGDPSVPCIGASGFISGIIAAYAITFPRARISFLVRLCWLSICAWQAFALWIIYQTVALMTAANSSVAYAAHLGGMIPGIIFAVIYKIRRRHQLSPAQQ